MSHAFSQKIYYSDTDAYGVVWHGSYLRFLEMGRVLLCEKFGYKLSQLEDMDIVLPVLNININYKKSAKLEDNVIIKTKVIEKGRYYVTFHQEIVDESEKNVYVEATVKVAAIHKNGKLYRSLPKPICDL